MGGACRFRTVAIRPFREEGRFFSSWWPVVRLRFLLRWTSPDWQNRYGPPGWIVSHSCNITFRNGVNGTLRVVRCTFQSDSLVWPNHVEDIFSIYGTEVAATNAYVDSTTCFLRSEEPLPFEEALVPAVNWASGQLLSEVTDFQSLISRSIYDEFLHYLLRELSIECEQVLNDNFIVFRQLKQSGFARILGLAAKGRSTKIYQEYIAYLLKGGMLQVFHDYPVLARGVAAITYQWIETTSEFFRCLFADINKIGEVFNNGIIPGPICKIELGVSDPHNNGRAVAILEFTSGLKLVYKPRCLAFEKAYFGLLEWLNNNRAPTSFKVIRILSCSTHGWMEFVHNTPCHHVQQVKAYYTTQNSYRFCGTMPNACPFARNLLTVSHTAGWAGSPGWAYRRRMFVSRTITAVTLRGRGRCFPGCRR